VGEESAARERTRRKKPPNETSGQPGTFGFYDDCERRMFHAMSNAIASRRGEVNGGDLQILRGAGVDAPNRSMPWNPGIIEPSIRPHSTPI